MIKDDDDILDLLDDRPPRNPMDDIANALSDISNYLWEIHQEVSQLAGIAPDRHDELISSMSSARQASAKTADAVEGVKFLLWWIALALTYIAYRLT